MISICFQSISICRDSRKVWNYSLQMLKRLWFTVPNFPYAGIVFFTITITFHTNLHHHRRYGMIPNFDTNNVSNLHFDHRHEPFPKILLKYLCVSLEMFKWSFQVHMGFSCIYKVILVHDFKYTFEFYIFPECIHFMSTTLVSFIYEVHSMYYNNTRYTMRSCCCLVNIYLLLYTSNDISNNNPLESFKLNMLLKCLFDKSIITFYISIFAQYQQYHDGICIV